MTALKFTVLLCCVKFFLLLNRFPCMTFLLQNLVDRGHPQPLSASVYLVIQLSRLPRLSLVGSAQAIPKYKIDPIASVFGSCSAVLSAAVVVPGFWAEQSPSCWARCSLCGPTWSERQLAGLWFFSGLSSGVSPSQCRRSSPEESVSEGKQQIKSRSNQSNPKWVWDYEVCNFTIL